MRLGLWLFATSLCAQTYNLTPANPKQGEVICVRAPREAAFATLGTKSIALFPQASGEALGLMPVKVDQAPGSYTLQFLDAGHQPLASRTVTVRDAHYPRQNIVLDAKTAELKAAPGELETVAAFRDQVSSTRYWEEPLLVPIPGCRTSPYGVARLYNGKPSGNYHLGIDQRGAQGTPVHAVAAGQVKLARPFQVHGNFVAIDHGQGLQSMYLHLSQFAVSEGQQVQAGEIIGYVGSTGRSTAPHLHWTLIANGESVNPAQWVALHACAPAQRKPRAKLAS